MALLQPDSQVVHVTLHLSADAEPVRKHAETKVSQGKSEYWVILKISMLLNSAL